jgi:hypothetical protein
MKKPNWRVAGAAGLAAGLTVGGFSMVSASSLERAVQTVEVRESQAAPAADTMVLALARATTAPEGTRYNASPDRHRAAPSPVVAVDPTAAPKVAPTVAAKVVHSDDCSDCSDCANGVPCADSVNSIDSVNSVHSVDSDD